MPRSAAQFMLISLAKTPVRTLQDQGHPTRAGAPLGHSRGARRVCLDALGVILRVGDALEQLPDVVRFHAVRRLVLPNGTPSVVQELAKRLSRKRGP